MSDNNEGAPGRSTTLIVAGVMLAYNVVVFSLFERLPPDSQRLFALASGVLAILLGVGIFLILFFKASPSLAWRSLLGLTGVSIAGGSTLLAWAGDLVGPTVFSGALVLLISALGPMFRKRIGLKTGERQN